jgi:hypothetical protein
MTRLRTLALQVALLIVPIGCVAPVESSPEGEQFDEAAMALIAENALIPNALIPNALIPNALIPSTLISNALILDTLDPSALAAIQDPGTGGTLSRMLVEYTVGCALTSDQSFSFSWTDAQNVIHNETYLGVLGIAPEWATGPLTVEGQEMVSACIAGRTNYSGTTVTISMRSLQSPVKTLVKSEELEEYRYVEGGFWGNLFAESPHLSACYTDADVSHSRSASRECATGHLDTDGEILPCGMIKIVGPCEEICQPLNGAGEYYPDCVDPVWGKIQNVATTALR